MKVSVKADVDDLKRAFAQLESNGVKAATSRALNKALGNMRTDAVRTVRQKRALPAGVIRNAFRMLKATKSRLVAELMASGRPIPLRDYGASQTRRGVTVRIGRGQKRSLVEHKGNRAFEIDSRGRHVFARETKRRLPIKKLFGPSIPTALTDEATQRSIIAVGRKAFLQRLREELRYETVKAGLRAK